VLGAALVEHRTELSFHAPGFGAWGLLLSMEATKLSETTPTPQLHEFKGPER
jgi:hypothetical protein